MNDLIGGAILLLLFSGVIGFAETLIRKNRIGAETARKSIHLAGGLGCLLFPFLVSSWITVLVLAVLFGATFHCGENLQMLHSLASVKRKSVGSLLFPFAVLFLFVVSDGRIWLYISALLVLVLADTAAALAGVHYGRIFYETAPGERKSLEGTLAFCTAGFIAVFLSLFLLTDIPATVCALTALLMAFLLAALEAVSVGGTDNLYVPLGTVFLLLKIPTKPCPEILFQCISLLCISIAVFTANQKYKTLRIRPLILFLLSAYASWTLGSAEWMIPVFVGFVLYNRLCACCQPLPALSARELLRPLYPALGILFIANYFHAFRFWFAPFTLAASTAASLCVINRFKVEPQSACHVPTRLLSTAALPVTVSFLLLLLLKIDGTARALAFALPLCAIPVVAYNRLIPNPLPPFAWKYAIPVIAGVAAVSYAGLQAAGAAPTLNPTTWAEVFR